MMTNEPGHALHKQSSLAEEFLAWLQNTLDAFFSGQGASVPCGECKACCRAGYFIPVSHNEWSTLAAIPARLLVQPPGTHSDGDSLISTTRRGDCAMLINRACSIYRQRPQACRDYDCRIFAAAGLQSGHHEIDRKINQWRFFYKDENSERAHEAVRTAAHFVLDHASAFPGGRVPDRPADIAVVALKSHRVFLGSWHRCASPEVIAKEIAQACRAFDTTGYLAPTLRISHETLHDIA